MPRQRLPPIVLEPSDQVDHSPTIPGLPEEASEKFFAESSEEQAIEPSGPTRQTSNVHHLPRPTLPPPYLQRPNLPPNLRTLSQPGRSPLDMSAVDMMDMNSEPGPSEMAQVRLGAPGDLLRPSILNIPIPPALHARHADDEPDPTVIPGRRIEIMPIPLPPKGLRDLEEPLEMAEEDNADDLEMDIDGEDVLLSDAPGADMASRTGRYDESAHPWLRQPRSSGIPDWAPLSAIALWATVSVMALADRFF